MENNVLKATIIGTSDYYATMRQIASNGLYTAFAWLRPYVLKYLAREGVKCST